jgi:hypothetical protein
VAAVDAGAEDSEGEGEKIAANEKGRRHECPAAFESSLV